MSAIAPVYPAQMMVNRAEIELVADETGHANIETLKSDQQRVAATQEVETAEAKAGVDLVI